MSVVKFKVEVYIELDTDEYHVPVDGKLALSLQEDMQEAIENNLMVQVEQIKIIKIGGKLNAEVRDNDYD